MNLLLKNSLLTTCLSAAALTGAAAEVIDYVVATVGQSAITVRDVKNHGWFDATLNHQSMQPLEKAREKLVTHMLIKNYLTSTGLLLTDTKDSIASLRKLLLARFTSEADLRKAAEKEGTEMREIDRLLEDQVQVRHFLEKILPSRVTLNEREVQAYYEQKKDARFLGKPLSQVENLVRAELRREKIKQEFERWLTTERKRTEIILLPLEAPIPSASASPPSASQKSP